MRPSLPPMVRFLNQLPNPEQVRMGYLLDACRKDSSSRVQVRGEGTDRVKAASGALTGARLLGTLSDLFF